MSGEEPNAQAPAGDSPVAPAPEGGEKLSKNELKRRAKAERLAKKKAEKEAAKAAKAAAAGAIWGRRAVPGRGRGARDAGAAAGRARS